MTLILSILFPLMFVFLSFVVGWTYVYVRKQKNVYVKGTLLAKIDPNTRRIYAYDIQFNKTIPKQFQLAKTIGKWESLDKTLDNYKGQIAERKMRSMIVKMQTGIPFAKESFKLTTWGRNNRTFDVFITMYQLEDSNDIGLTIKWEQTKKDEKVKKKIFVPTDKSTISGLKFNYKGFVAFQLKSNIENVTDQFFEQLNKIYKLNKRYYFITNGMFVVVIGDNKASKTKKKVKALVELMETKGSKRGLNRMYSGTSYTIAKEVESLRRINSVLELLNFNINLSLRTEKQFVNRHTIEFNLDEYKVVAEGTKVFKTAIKAKDINSKVITVKNEDTNRKIMVYTFPEVEGITNEIQNIILRDKENETALINAYAEMVAIEGLVKEPALIDINNSWFAQNYKDMNYKRAIYVLNYNPFQDVKTVKEIKEMTEKGFTFAIRIKVFNENITTIIKKSKPQFIVIDQVLSDVKEPENYIQLLSIKKLADISGIRMIFENPSSNVDSSMAETLGIKYVYRF